MTPRFYALCLLLIAMLGCENSNKAPNKVEVAQDIFATPGSIRPDATEAERAQFERGEQIAPHAEVLHRLGATVGCSLELHSACARRLFTRGGAGSNSLLCTCSLDGSACKVGDKKPRMK